MRKLTTHEFIEKAITVHGTTYSYQDTSYTNMQTKVSVFCPKHQKTFVVSPVKHIAGTGCPTCTKEQQAARQQIDTPEFIRRAKSVHGEIYDYSSTVYVNNKDKVEVICRVHGSFLISPNNHTSKANKCGCSECGRIAISNSKFKDTNWFVSEAKKLHGDTFDYSNSTYVDHATKIEIKCKSHGPFFQLASQHFKTKRCCPKCTTSSSKAETALLDYVKVPNSCRQKWVHLDGKRFSVDALDYNTNTIYEFYGDYWHGNLTRFDSDAVNSISNKTFGQLNLETIQREQLLREAGFNLITIWESEWDKIKPKST
jgi:hypothetical protein